jgi:hypothetical protein
MRPTPTEAQDLEVQRLMILVTTIGLKVQTTNPKAQKRELRVDRRKTKSLVDSSLVRTRMWNPILLLSAKSKIRTGSCQDLIHVLIVNKDP